VRRSRGSLLERLFARFFNRGRATTFATRYDRGSGSFEIVTGGRTWRAEAVEGKGRLSKSGSAEVTKVDSMADVLSSLAGISSGASVSVPSLLWRREEDSSWLRKLQGVERLPDVRSRGRNLLAIKGSSPAIDYELWIDSADFTICRIVRRVHVKELRFEDVIDYTHVRIGGVTEPGS